MLHRYCLLLVPMFLFGCNKKEKVTIAEQITPKDTIKVVPLSFPEAVAIDSSYFANSSDAVKQFYKNNLYRTVWTIEKDRKALTESIKNSELDGLNPEDYNIKTFTEQENNHKSLPEKDLIANDILHTEIFYKLAGHLYNGKIEPTKLYSDWDMYSKEIDLSHKLQYALKNHTIQESLDSLKPNHIVYLRLKDALHKIESMPNDNLKNIAVKDKLVPNDTNASVIDIKKRLAYWGDYKKPDSLTKIYDDKTQTAVKKFQKRHGLTPDGVIGKGTVAAMNFSKAQRKKQIIANLERWRWFPRDMGESYVIINIPDFNLYLVDHNDTIQNHRVVVGRAKRRTPVLSSKFSNLVINPTWTVPPTILKEDLTPSASRNLNYFAATGITIYDMKGNVVSPDNWNANKSNNYRYVQKPGSNNSLGLIKFNFSNKHLVYLHDTNHRDYFKLNNRALSSGCIRVEDPFKLSGFILEKEESNWSKERVDKMIASNKTQSIVLKKPTFVHQLYWTAWMDKDGLEFRNDIYDLDFELYQKLRD